MYIYRAGYFKYQYRRGTQHTPHRYAQAIKKIDNLMNTNTIAAIILCFCFFNVKSQVFDRKEYFENLKEDTISLEDLKYKGVSFTTNEKIIIETLGKPDSIKYPQYNCGGFSNEWQGKEYVQYYYESLNYIGEGGWFIIEKVNFEINDSIFLTYFDNYFNSKTGIKLIEKLFPKSYINRYVENNGDNLYENVYLLPQLISDDNIILCFKNGLLISITYFTPC